MTKQKSYRAAWVLSGAARGSGGFRTVLVHAEALKKIGVESYFYYYDKLNDAHPLPSSENIKWSDKLHRKLFSPTAKIASKIARMGLKPENIRFGWEAHADEIRNADMVFATTWITAYAIDRLKVQGAKFYFVQAQEHWCHARGDNYYLAQDSYRLGLNAITIGRSLCRSLHDDFRMQAYYYDYGADLSVYFRDRTVKRHDNTVAFLFQPKKIDRCVGLGLEALRLVKQARPDVNILLYGSRSHQNPVKVPFEHEHLGLLSLKELNRLFNRATVGLSLSAVNPSRTSFEMMACGLVPVEIHGKNSIYDFPNDASVLAHGSPQGLANALLGVLKNKSRRLNMEKAAVKFMSRRDQKKIETAQSSALVKTIMEGKKPKQAKPQKLYKAIPVE